MHGFLIVNHCLLKIQWAISTDKIFRWFQLENECVRQTIKFQRGVAAPSTEDLLSIHAGAFRILSTMCFCWTADLMLTKMLRAVVEYIEVVSYQG